MPHIKSTPKKKRKFRLLLDSAFAKADSFPKLRKKANLAHPVHDYGLPTQAEDEEIYQLAVKENRFVVTINYKDFRKLVRKGKPGVIAIPPYLSNAEIDRILTSFISGKDPKDYQGKAVKMPVK